MYKILPFKLLDGINEYGVFANTNVVPTQKGETSGTTPLESQEIELCNLMLPRFILDNFKTAAEAIDYLKKHASIYRYEPLALMGDDIHVMVGDANETYVIEFIENALVAKKFDKPIMTNFFVNDIDLNNDGSVYTPKDYWANPTQDPITKNGITSHGAGLERFNLINSNYNSIEDFDSAKALAINLFYTNTYKDVNPIWYSECVGDYGSLGEINLNSPKSAFDSAMAVMKEDFEHRSREENNTWQTVHSCVYDIENRKVAIISQEENKDTPNEVVFDYFTSDQTEKVVENKIEEKIANIVVDGGEIIA